MLRASSLGIRLPQCRTAIRLLSLELALTEKQPSAREESDRSRRDFPVGKPWQRNPIPHATLRRRILHHRKQPLPGPHDVLLSPKPTAYPIVADISPVDLTDPKFYHRFLQTLADTQSPTDAWDAYTAVLALPRPRGLPKNKRIIPLAILKRLSILIAASQPRTREQFLRLLSVLQHFRKAGGTLQVHQWNALVAAAGNGWRKKRPEDFKLALDIFNDMISQRAPGSTLSDSANEDSKQRGEAAKPDLFTYNTLITIAARTLSAPALNYATSLLKSSGIPPNRITHLSLLRYFTHTKQLSGIRSTLFKMREQGLDVGLDGINACMWAYSHNDRVDLASMVYRVLRHHISPELTIGEHDIDATIEYLATVEGIVVPYGMVPNRITYTIMLQALAYHGDLIQSLNVFMDMLSSLNWETGAPLQCHENGKGECANYLPTLPAFRAIFLGFARHATPPPKAGGSFSARLRSLSNKSPWTLSHLDALFESFIVLPGDVRPQPLVYWIMVAFAKTSGNDVAKLRDVWKRLEDRFGGPWGGQGNRLERLRKTLFPHEKRKGRG